MPRFRIFVALFMAALWLPATQHCGLEAAGIFASHNAQSDDAGCCAGSGACAQDGCTMLESGNYPGSVNALNVAAPSLVACLCLICRHTVAAGADERPGIFVHTHYERTLDWVPTWQFEQRAALPPGAPSSLVA